MSDSSQSSNDMGQAAVSEAVQSKRQLSRLAATTRLLTRIIASVLALAFAWLKLRGIPLPAVTSEPAALVVLRLALVAYYFSWFLGVMVDTRDEEDVLYTTPSQGKLPPTAVSIVIGIGIGFGVLCWVSTYRDFVLALGTFWMINIGSWRYFISFIINPSINRSLEEYRSWDTPIAEAQVLLLKDFLCGAWQWWRFGLGTLSIFLLATLAYTPIASDLASRIGFLSEHGVMAVAILIHIGVFQSWIWFQRIRRRIEIRQLERLGKEYVVNRGATESTAVTAEVSNEGDMDIDDGRDI